MGKSTKKVVTPTNRGTYKGKRISFKGGKDLRLYGKSSKNKSFSGGDPSESDDDQNDDDEIVEHSGSASSSDSDSESSLTEMSDKEGFDVNENSAFLKSPKRDYGVRGKSMRSGKNISYYGNKKPRKSTKFYSVPWDKSTEEDSDDDDEDENDYTSSSDGSDVDFVKLQAEKKQNSKKSSKDSHQHCSIQEKQRRRSSVAKPKFGRRKSRTALPNDIDFKLDFNVVDASAIANESDIEEEDMGEEVDGNYSHNDAGTSKSVYSNEPLIEVPKLKDEEIESEDYEIDDNELLATLQADNDIGDFNLPQLESSKTEMSLGALGDDYDEDNDEENDPFLREEERFLVNEFENNGFDEVDIGYADSQKASDQAENEYTDFGAIESSRAESTNDYLSDIEEDNYGELSDFEVPFLGGENGDSDDEKSSSVSELALQSTRPTKTTKTGEEVTNKLNSRIRSIEQDTDDDDDDSYLWNYFFSSDNNSSGSDNEKEGGEDTVTDFLNNQKSSGTLIQGKNIFKDNQLEEKRDHFGIFASDQEYDSGESTDVDLSLPETTEKSNLGSKVAKEVLSSKTADYRPPMLGTWVTMDTKPFGIIDGLSTRTLAGAGGKSQDRLKISQDDDIESSDYSALGLDELLNISEMDDEDNNDVRIWRDFNAPKKQIPLGAFRNKSILHSSVIHPENVTNNYSDASTEFNGDFNKRRYSVHRSPNLEGRRRSSIRRGSNTQRRSSANSYDSMGDSKASATSRHWRRASIVEALSEGLRPTKSGLFSEKSLADVEELFGEDADLMSLIEGL